MPFRSITTSFRPIKKKTTDQTSEVRRLISEVRAEQPNLSDEDIRKEVTKRRTLGPGVALTAKQQEIGGFLGTAGRFLGPEKLGRRIGAGIANLFPEQRKLLRGLEEQGFGEAAGQIKTGGVTGLEALASGARTALSLALPFLGKSLTAGKLLTRVAKSSVVGGTFGVAGGAENTDDLKSILVQGLLGATVGAAIPLAGVGIRAVGRGVEGLPRKLFNQVFRRDKPDIKKLFETKAVQRLQQDNPELFAQLRRQGSIRTDKAGNAIINPELAKEALERGFRGSNENMAVKAIINTREIEQKLQGLLRNSTRQVSFTKATPKSSYVNLLTNIRDAFGKTVFSDRAKEAQGLINQLNRTKSEKIPAQTALVLRRFLDGMRSTSSFRTDANLAPKQEQFKFAASFLRNKLASIPGIRNLMNEYRVNIQVTDSLVEDAVRRGNLRLLGIQDVLIGGGGVASGAPGVGLGAAAAVRGLQQPTALTSAAQAIQRGLIAPTKKALGSQIPGQLGTVRQAAEQAARQIGIGAVGQ